MEVSSRQVCEDVFLLMEHVKRSLYRVGEAHKLTPPQISALYCLTRGQTTMGAVASKLHCDASNVTGIIDRLVSQKLVVRAESEQDRRTKNLELTEGGKRVVEEVWVGLTDNLGCSRLTSAERQSLHALFVKLIQTV
jgi:DNA-binding MarR family transcriptional regulator